MIVDPAHVAAEYRRVRLPVLVDEHDLARVYLELADHEVHPAPAIAACSRPTFAAGATTIDLALDADDRRHHVRLHYRGVMRPRVEYLGRAAPAADAPAQGTLL